VCYNVFLPIIDLPYKNDARHVIDLQYNKTTPGLPGDLFLYGRSIIGEKYALTGSSNEYISLLPIIDLSFVPDWYMAIIWACAWPVAR
jgi:hypothetical protein